MCGGDNVQCKRTVCLSATLHLSTSIFVTKQRCWGKGFPKVFANKESRTGRGTWTWRNEVADSAEETIFTGNNSVYMSILVTKKKILERDWVLWSVCEPRGQNEKRSFSTAGKRLTAQKKPTLFFNINVFTSISILYHKEVLKAVRFLYACGTTQNRKFI